MWLAKTPGGPSVKFLVSNVHTMAELKLAGNHLKVRAGGGPSFGRRGGGLVL